MENGNDNDLKTHSTTILDGTDLFASEQKLVYSSSSSSSSASSSANSLRHDPRVISAANNGGIGEQESSGASTVGENNIETANFDEMKRLDLFTSPVSVNVVEFPAKLPESSDPAFAQEVNDSKLKLVDCNRGVLDIGKGNDFETSSDEDDHPHNFLEIEPPLPSSQSEVLYHNNAQVDVKSQPLEAMDGQNESVCVSEAGFSPRGKTARLSSSSSTSSSSDSDSNSDSDSLHEKSFQLGSEETGKSSNGNTNTTKQDPDKKIASDFSDDGQFPTQYPPLQVMERHEDPPSSPYRIPSHIFGRTKSNTPMEDPPSSPYRIPSHIFGRTKSNTPMEWSVASNESLFSIHMGNMSFSKDQLCWLGKSGELCKPGEYMAPPFPKLPSNQTPSLKPAEVRQKNPDPEEEPVVTEATAAETMREVIRESAENKNKQNSSPAEPVSQSASLSNRSDGSTKSFAFPILTGDGGMSISLKGGGGKQKNQFQSPPPSQPSSQPSTPKDSNESSASAKFIKNGFHLRCFSCLSCWPFCLRT